MFTRGFCFFSQCVCFALRKQQSFTQEDVTGKPVMNRPGREESTLFCLFRTCSNIKAVITGSSVRHQGVIFLQWCVPLVMKSAFAAWALWSSDTITVSFSIFCDDHFHVNHLLSRQIPTPDLRSWWCCWFLFLSMTPWQSAHTPTHTHKEDTRTLASTTYLLYSSRRSSHFGWFTGALITLCLLALVNTMTTWQCLNIWNTVIISSSSKKTHSVILIAGSWLSAPTTATPVCHLPGRHGKKAAQKKKCSG